MSDNKPVIFISYSHKDRTELEYVRSHLGPIASLGSVFIWDDNNLQIGDDWKGDTNSAIDACTVFILLVSRHSLSSKFIQEVELPRILPRWQSKQVSFFPIVVTPCHMDGYWWLDTLNRRPKNGQALSELTDFERDREMTAIAADIARTLAVREKAEVVEESNISSKPKKTFRKKKTSARTPTAIPKQGPRLRSRPD
jgi:hypothetical protein